MKSQGLMPHRPGEAYRGSQTITAAKSNMRDKNHCALFVTETCFLKIFSEENVSGF